MPPSEVARFETRAQLPHDLFTRRTWQLSNGVVRPTSSLCDKIHEYLRVQSRGDSGIYTDVRFTYDVPHSTYLYGRERQVLVRTGKAKA